MKKLFAVVLSGIVLTSCNTVAPVEPATEGHALSANDIQVIEQQIEVSGGVAALKQGAAQVLSAEQLAFAEATLPGLNQLAASDNWEFTELSNGTVRPTGELAVQTEEMMKDSKLQAQFCSAYIQSVSWINRGGSYPYSASNIPTRCGRLGYFSIMNAWNESVNKTPPSSHWSKIPGTTAYQSMYNQFLCHTDMAFLKDEWNLEPNRPVVPYYKMILPTVACNPG